MQLTSDLAGSILYLNETSQIVRIRSVDPHTFTYFTDKGEMFSSYNKNVPGKLVPVRDLPSGLLKRFDVAKVLTAAEASAYSCLLNSKESAAEHAIAKNALSFVDSYRQDLVRKSMQRYQDPGKQGPRPGLENLIRQASDRFSENNKHEVSYHPERKER